MRCPGQDTRYWGFADIFEIPCPKCGKEVEFFKDEPSRRCKNCGHILLNPLMDFGCATYCKYAQQCLGNLPPELLSQRADLLKNRVAMEMKRYYNRDFKRIGHASKVARYAERIARSEGADLGVVIICAYLHDIGIKEAECRGNENLTCNHEKLGAATARQILERLNADLKMIEEVCDIIAHHHHPSVKETLNFQALYDADMIVNMEEKVKDLEGKGIDMQGKGADFEKNVMYSSRMEKIINESLFTETGKRIAREVLSSRE